MQSRTILDPAHISKAALERMGRNFQDTVSEVSRAVAEHDVVVVGMAQNPHVRNVRKLLTEAGVTFTYLEYGSYFSAWRKRLAIKQWSGWSTFPQVFVRGTLMGGEDLTRAALEDGSLKALLAKART